MPDTSSSRVKRLTRRMKNRPQNNSSTVDQSAYWNEIAQGYDQLYSNQWSLLEDRLVCKRLSSIDYNHQGIVLDLACGTGHGYELLRASLGTEKYQGVDISQAMLDQMAIKHPNLSTMCGTMNDLSSLPTSHYALVTVFYSSASYTNDPLRLLREIHRLLEPQGYLYYSALTKTSLRRILHAKRGALEFYKTRGDTTNAIGVESVALSRRQIRATAVAAGFQLISLRGHGALAGVCEHPIAWPPSRFIDMTMPFFSHSQDLIARKVS